MGYDYKTLLNTLVTLCLINYPITMYEVVFIVTSVFQEANLQSLSSVLEHYLEIQLSADSAKKFLPPPQGLAFSLYNT